MTSTATATTTTTNIVTTNTLTTNTLTTNKLTTMSTKRVNVLIYAGNGTTTASVKHATWSLRRLLGPNYAVLTVTGEQILHEPWQASCALLVIPGGADLGYARTLNGAGNRRIKQYVQLGGKYLGLCAGGYYGSARCEWEVGKKGMEVVGERELAFFPGICRGLAFGGFEYRSEAGTRAAGLRVEREGLAVGGGAVPERLRAYYNGGGVFVDADEFKERGVEVVARYTDELDVEGGDAAIVYCKVGEGGVLLSGPHPEYVPHSQLLHIPNHYTSQPLHITTTTYHNHLHPADSPAPTSTATTPPPHPPTAPSSTPSSTTKSSASTS